MGEVKGVLPYKCPSCNKFMNTTDWRRISYGNEISTASNKYSYGKGIAGGLLFGTPGTLLGYSPSKGSSKSKRIDTYACRYCGATVPREIETFY